MSTILSAALSAPPTCEAKTRMFDTARDGVPYCRVKVALRSLIDASGNRRYFCHAPGHRGLVVRSYGESARAELERGTATFDAPDWDERKARMDAEMMADLELMADEFHGRLR